MRNKKTVLAATCVAALGYSAASFSYDVATHDTLSLLTADKSRIYTDPSLLSDLGFNISTTFRLVDLNGASAGQGDARTVIALAAQLEDYANPALCAYDWARPLNHFFDPQHNGRGLQVGAMLGHASPTWALEDQGEVTTISFLCKAEGGRPQTFSYANAQSDLYTALTAGSAANREAAMSLTLQKLGHVVHHVQDMAQPQHTRNDTHSPWDQADRPWFENYTRRFVSPTRLAAIVAANPYPVPNFARARDYWYTTGAAGPSYVGMAEFSSNNYVSQGTGFRSTGAGVLANPDFPLPDGSGKSVAVRTVTITPRVGSTITAPMAVVTGSIVDGYAYGVQPGKTLATMSVLDKLLAQSGHTRLFTVSSLVFEDQYPTLLPRAVAFSAGLINHFFAGKLGLRRATGGTGWIIDNMGSDALNGSFQMFYETSAGQRSLVPGGVWSGALQPSASTVTLPEPPSGTVKLVAVFYGLIGSESMRRTAGKVVNYLPPPIPCGGNLKRSGDITGLDATVEMGTNSGTVQLSFEAFSIKDSLAVTAMNAANTQLATTGGMVSGLHKKTFTFNSATLGTSKARVRIVGSEEGTLWDVAMSCPGKQLSAADFPPTRSVIFEFGATLSGATGSCQADFFVDGVRVGLAYVSGSGGTGLTQSLTKGAGHGAEFRNFSCTANNNNLLIGAEYTDPSGTVRLQNMNQAGIRLFDVR